MKDEQAMVRAVSLLREAGWTVRPPCVECDATFADDNLGQCALAAHVERPTKMRDDKTYCACGRPWPCLFSGGTE